jgi:predicted metallo-beta-lactamase superfamily hydrolase
VDHGERERFIFASDIQGPLSPVAAGWLRRQRPTLLYLSGPPSYMQHEVGAEAIDRGIAHLVEVLDASGCRVIMDHYALRDGGWRERFAPLWATGRVQTAAGWCGEGETPLEARRRELWGGLRRPGTKAGEGRATIGDTPRVASRAGKGGHTE